MKLNKKEWALFSELINKADNSDLYKLKDELEKEIRLSETAINEGFENEN
jgi:hypothetical protein